MLHVSLYVATTGEKSRSWLKGNRKSILIERRPKGTFFIRMLLFILKERKAMGREGGKGR